VVSQLEARAALQRAVSLVKYHLARASGVSAGRQFIAC
jgi:hypothetical protein